MSAFFSVVDDWFDIAIALLAVFWLLLVWRAIRRGRALERQRRELEEAEIARRLRHYDWPPVSRRGGLDVSRATRTKE